MGETMLRVANVRSEDELEAVRDALDALGAIYEHVDSEPNEDSFPQTAPLTSSNRTSSHLQTLEDAVDQSAS